MNDDIKSTLRDAAARDRRAWPASFPLTFLFAMDRPGLESVEGVRFEADDGSSATIRYDTAIHDLVFCEVHTPEGYAPAFLELDGCRTVADPSGSYRLHIERIDDYLADTSLASVILHKRPSESRGVTRGPFPPPRRVGDGTVEFGFPHTFVFDDGTTAGVQHDGKRLVVGDLVLPAGWEADQLVVRGSTPAMLLPTENAGEFAAALPLAALESGNDLVLVVFSRRIDAAPAKAPSGWKLRAASASAMTGDIEFAVVATDWKPDYPCRLLVGGPDCDEATIELPPGPGWRRARLPERDAGWRTGAFTLVAGDLHIRGCMIDGEFWVREPGEQLTAGQAFDLVRTE